MFSLIKKGIHALKPESCSLCPYGDGTHPPAKIRWDILDKEGKPLASKKRIASGSLLMLPDQVEADGIGGPRHEVLPELFCEIQRFTELPRIGIEVSTSVPPEPVGPPGEPVRFEGGTFEPSSHFAWAALNDPRSPLLTERWMRTHGDPAIPSSFQTMRGQPWRPPSAGLRLGPLHPIDQEIGVQLRALPSAFPLQAALPVSVPEKLTWANSRALANDWCPSGHFMAAPEVRKHRPLYAAPSTPLPRQPLPKLVTSDLRAIAAARSLPGLEIREDNRLRNWTAAARGRISPGQPPLTMPHAPLMRQRFRGWQGTPRMYECLARDQRLVTGLQPAGPCAPTLSPFHPPAFTPVRPDRLQLASGPMARWANPSSIPLATAALHSAGFGRPTLTVPEIPD